MFHRLSLASLLVSAACLLPACGGAGLSGVLTDAGSSPYLAQCQTRSAQQAKDLASGAYNPAVLFVHAWPGSTTQTMAEANLAAALSQNQTRRTLVIARGGLGKTKLAESLTGQLCGVIPTFTIDLKEAAKALAAGKSNVIRDAVLAAAGVAGKPAAADLMAELGEGRLVLFLDAIEETDLEVRPKVMAEINGLARDFPKAQLVLLARPPVLDVDYGFAGLDAKVEIPSLDCKISETFVARKRPDDDQRRQFQQFLRRYKLDEKGTFGVMCTYPYLSTYRDINTMDEFQRAAATGDIMASFSSVYEELISARLKKEYENLRWSKAEALDMIDRLVRVQSITGGQAALVFDMPTCETALQAKWGDASVDSGIGGSPEQRRRHVCEKTFQSALFKKGEGDGKYQFADKFTEELFLARWLNNETARNNQDCTTVSKNSTLLHNKGIVTFFAGQALGRRCLGQTVSELCTKTSLDSEHVEPLELGLPIGKARADILREGRASASTLKPEGCIKKVFDSLDATVSE
jgi:hypothetical protein